MSDLLWDIATSYPVLGMIGLVFLAALIVGYFPLLKWVPAVGQYVPAARLVVLLSAALLCFLFGFRVSDGRAEAKSLRLQLAAKSIDLTAANAAAQQSDTARQELAAQAISDEVRIANYAAELKKRPNAACTLTDDDFPDRVRKPSR